MAIPVGVALSDSGVGFANPSSISSCGGVTIVVVTHIMATGVVTYPKPGTGIAPTITLNGVGGVNWATPDKSGGEKKTL